MQQGKSFFIREIRYFQVIGNIEGTGIILYHTDDVGYPYQYDGFQAVLIAELIKIPDGMEKLTENLFIQTFDFIDNENDAPVFDTLQLVTRKGTGEMIIFFSVTKRWLQEKGQAR